MNLPNILTLIRFILIPIFAYFLNKYSYGIAAILFVVAGITDVLDGYFARKYNQITDWGKLADPLADKLIQITALVILMEQRKIPMYVVAIVMMKEVLMGTGSLLLLKKENHVVSANWYGKMATVIFYLAIVSLILFVDMSEAIRIVFVWIAILCTIFAFFMYYTQIYRKIRKESKG